MELFIYLDESGSIHSNSKTNYFAVGGFLISKKDKNKAISIYRKNNKTIKDNRGYPLNMELKSYHYTDQEKIRIFNDIQQINSFVGISVIFNKPKMKKKIIKSNVFFNYAVKILLENNIFPFLNKINYVFNIIIDNRNIKVGDLKDLERYLNTEFILYNYKFIIKYYDSSCNFGIQLADLCVNTIYNYYKNKKIVKAVMPYLKYNKFFITTFPSSEVFGKIYID